MNLLINSVYCFDSGERTSAKQWNSVVEIKGRVRLDAFEKFLQDLRMSRSRAIMVSKQPPFSQCKIFLVLLSDKRAPSGDRRIPELVYASFLEGVGPPHLHSLLLCALG